MHKNEQLLLKVYAPKKIKTFVELEIRHCAMKSKFLIKPQHQFAAHVVSSIAIGNSCMNGNQKLQLV